MAMETNPAYPETQREPDSSLGINLSDKLDLSSLILLDSRLKNKILEKMENWVRGLSFSRKVSRKKFMESAGLEIIP